MTVVGSPTLVIEGVQRALRPQAFTHFSVSANGSLIYLPGPVGTADEIALQRALLAEVDRQGQVNLTKLGTAAFAYARYSPAGTQVVFELNRDPQPRQIGIFDLSGATAVRPLTLSGSSHSPLWSPDGRRVTFQSDREGDMGLFSQRADGTGPTERLTRPEPGTSHEPDTWSPDGQTLLFEAVKDRQFSLWTLALRDRKIERFGTVESPWYINATFPPSGRWVAYGAGGGAASRVYVEPFPPTGDRYVVTNESARDPFWSPDGKELFYASGMDQFRAVTFLTQPVVTFGNAVPVPRGGLFEIEGSSRRQYDLSPDGKRILGAIAAPTARQALAPTIQVVINWSEELKTKVP